MKAWKEEKLNPWDDVLARWLLLLGLVDQRKGEVYNDIFKKEEGRLNTPLPAATSA